jgi:hypothetical protein
VIVGQGDTVHTKVRKDAYRLGWGPEKEAFQRVGPTRSPGGDTTLEIDDDEVGLAQCGDDAIGEQGVGWPMQQSLAHSSAQHDVPGEGEPNLSSPTESCHRWLISCLHPGPGHG